MLCFLLIKIIKSQNNLVRIKQGRIKIMSFTQSKFNSPSNGKTQQLSNKSAYFTLQKNQKPFTVQKSVFDDCFYHQKPIKYLCLSNDCKCKYYTLCDSEQCRNMHAHPNFNIISLEKFQHFKYKHLSSINMLKKKVQQYEKQVIQSLIHQVSKDFQSFRYSMDLLYMHRAARKLNQQKYSEITAADLNKFVQHTIQEQDEQEQLSSQRSHMNEAKKFIISGMQKLRTNLNSLVQTKQYEDLTLKNLVSDKTNQKSPLRSVQIDTFDSKIIQFRQQFDAIMKMLRQNRAPTFSSFNLIFRASQFNYSAYDYHKKVDNISPTLTIIKSQGGKKFGAFLNTKVQQTKDWISDASGLSFIFSLDHNQSYRLKPSANFRTKAIFGGNKGPQIGSGCDIYISDECHLNKQSGANLGGSYQVPFGVEYNSAKGKSYLASKQNFSVLQYEVYHLV